MSNKHPAMTISSLVTPVYKLMIIVVILCLYLTSFYSIAASLDDLINNNELTINTRVKSQEQQIVKQPLIIEIEVATNRWFAKGTQVENFELSEAIMLANSKTSINGTKQINGQTWSTQTHEITLYPTRAGQYNLPPILVNVSVNTQDSTTVEGVLKTTEQQFTISLPQALQNIEQFIVSELVTVETNFQNENQEKLALGDAVTQTITIKAQGTPAMMIYPLKVDDISGVSIYRKTPQVTDTANRGELLGTRVETLSYIFEQSGEYHLPEQIIYWWNTNTQTLEKIILASQQYHVGSSPNHHAVKQQTFNIAFSQWIPIIIGLIFSFIVISYLPVAKYKQNVMQIVSNLKYLKQRQTRKAFIQSIAHHDYIAAMHHLTKYSELVNINLMHFSTAEILTLNELAFGKKNNSTTFNHKDSLKLLNDLKTNKVNSKTLFNPVMKIRLNNQDK